MNSELTGYKLNRAIAKRLGWTMWTINGVYLELHDPSGNNIATMGLDEDLAWRVPAVPDWAHDTALALALCLELIPAAWVCVQKWGASRERFCATVLITGAGDKAERPLVEGVIADTEAQALALLALKALGAV